MPRVNTKAGIREQTLFETLQKKGVRIPLFRTEARTIAAVGVPALIMWYPRAARGKKAVLQRAMVARISEVAPTLLQTRKCTALFIQQYIAGYEIACGVMKHGGHAVPLVPVEVIPRERHASLPWHLSEEHIELVQRAAHKAHEAMGAGTHSSVRCVVTHTNQVYVTGVDCVPPLSPTSLFVQSARAAGFTVSELIHEFRKIKKSKIKNQNDNEQC